MMAYNILTYEYDNEGDDNDEDDDEEDDDDDEDDIEAKDEEVGAWFRGLLAPNPRVAPPPLPSGVLNVIRKEMFNNEQLLSINIDDVRDPAEARDAQKLVTHMLDVRTPEEEKIALIVQKPLVSHKCFTAVRYGVMYKDIGAPGVKDDVMDRD